MKMDDYLLIKIVDLLEAPEDYLLANNFKEIDSDAYNKRQKAKRKTK